MLFIPLNFGNRNKVKRNPRSFNPLFPPDRDRCPFEPRVLKKYRVPKRCRDRQFCVFFIPRPLFVKVFNCIAITKNLFLQFNIRRYYFLFLSSHHRARSKTFNAVNTARTLLILFLEPNILLTTFGTPANFKTTRTAPPAFTPVPFGAGFKNNLAAPSLIKISCGIVSLTNVMNHVFSLLCATLFLRLMPRPRPLLNQCQFCLFRRQRYASAKTQTFATSGDARYSPQIYNFFEQILFSCGRLYAIQYFKVKF